MATTITLREKKIAKAKALTAAKTTPVLLLSLTGMSATIDAARAKAAKTQNYDECEALNIARMWIVDELISRFPAAEEAMTEAFDADFDGIIDYDALLIETIRAQLATH